MARQPRLFILSAGLTVIHFRLRLLDATAAAGITVLGQPGGCSILHPSRRIDELAYMLGKAFLKGTSQARPMLSKVHTIDKIFEIFVPRTVGRFVNQSFLVLVKYVFMEDQPPDEKALEPVPFYLIHPFEQRCALNPELRKIPVLDKLQIKRR